MRNTRRMRATGTLGTRLRAGAGTALLLALSTAAGAADPPPTMAGCDLTPEAGDEAVYVQTPLGAFQIELYPNVAPQTVANFLGYIERGDYEDTLVHRIVPGIVMQTGGFRFQDVFFEAVETQPPVPNEPCISNVAGTVAMAKLDGQPDSATSQWFVNLGDNLGLDSSNGGFTVFGRVRGHGVAVARAIAMLTETVPIDPVPYYQASVSQPLWDFYRASPLREPLDLEAVAAGCFDPDASGVVLAQDPQSYLDLEPDDMLELQVTLASTACETGGGPGAPAFACEDPGRRILLMDPATTGLFPDPDAPFGLLEAEMSCDGLAASEQSFTTRLEQIGAQLDGRFIKLRYSVPEPGAAVSGAAGLLTLLALRRRRRGQAVSGARRRGLTRGTRSAAVAASPGRPRGAAP